METTRPQRIADHAQVRRRPTSRPQHLAHRRKRRRTPPGQIAVITGPQRSALVQYLAERHCGLAYVNQVIVRKLFPLRTCSRFAHAHWTVTILTKPRVKNYLTDPQRTFHVPPDLPKAA